MMEKIDFRWLTIFVAQLAVGLLLTLYQPDGDNKALGLMLIGGAFGQGVTASLKATKPNGAG